MRKITINSKEYNVLMSFYRTHGSVNQQYFSDRMVEESKLDNIFYGRIFHHVVDINTDTMYFVKEYLKDKDLAKFEYDAANILSSYSDIMKVYDIDDGKILCEFVRGIQFSSIGRFSKNQITDVVILIGEFICDLVNNDQHHLIEVNLNNVILNFDEDKKIFNHKIIDFESNPDRYEEFRNKNLNFMVFLKDILYYFRVADNGQKTTTGNIRES